MYPRARLARKKSIKDHVETLFNWKGKMMPSGTDLRQNELGSVEQGPGTGQGGGVPLYPVDFTERVQSFFPECKCPYSINHIISFLEFYQAVLKKTECYIKPYCVVFLQ